MKLIITGTGSGLGKHLQETLGGDVFRRERDSVPRAADVIIHTAWPARPPETNDSLAAYFEDTLQLTRRLTESPHGKFIFISTAEVYPLNAHSGAEDESIRMEGVRNLYAHCKLMAEAIVCERGRDVLILRSTGLLGTAARRNSLIRILTEERPALTLSAESQFYYVLHEDMSAFIRIAIERNLTGIYNACSSRSVTLGEVARVFGRRVNWGDFTYAIGSVTNRKISEVAPQFDKTSIEVVRKFVQNCLNPRQPTDNADLS